MHFTSHYGKYPWPHYPLVTYFTNYLLNFVIHPRLRTTNNHIIRPIHLLQNPVLSLPFTMDNRTNFSTHHYLNMLSRQSITQNKNKKRSNHSISLIFDPIYLHRESAFHLSLFCVSIRCTILSAFSSSSASTVHGAFQ